MSNQNILIMVYKDQILTHPAYPGRRFKQVNRRTARKLYDQGRPVLLHPSNMIFNNVWQAPLEISNGDGIDFETHLYNFEFYMPSELGRYVHFFVDVNPKSK